MTHSATLGVLLVAHGTVTDLDEMRGFLTAIRRGRPPSDALVDEMRRRYDAIGGSPLLETTNRQARTLAARLNLPAFVGMRFGEPSLERALRDAEGQGIERLVVVPMAPYSVSLYFGEVRARRWAMPNALGASDPQHLTSIAPFGTHPLLIRAHVDQIRSFAGAALEAGAKLVLSAHSLPMRVIETGDAYERETQESARSIGKALGEDFRIAYQSQGADGGRWLGPVLHEEIASLAASGAKAVVVAPFGFLCDHVETLYDLDIELKAQCDSLGLVLHRVPALGLHDCLMDALVDLVQEALTQTPKMCKKEDLPC